MRWVGSGTHNQGTRAGTTLHSAEYSDIEVKDGQLVLTPVRIPRADGLCAKSAELDPGEQDIAAAVAWAR